MQVWTLVWEDPLEREMKTHSSILAWEMPWTEECGGLHSMGLQRVRHDWSNLACTQNVKQNERKRIQTWLLVLHAFQFSLVQLLSHVRLFETLWTAACQASLSITNFWSLLKLMSIESVMPSNHLILCHSLLLLPSIFPTIRVFSNESALCIRWPKYWSFSFSISPSNQYSGLISFRMDWFDLLICSYSIIMYYHNINILSLSPCCVLY